MTEARCDTPSCVSLRLMLGSPSLFHEPLRRPCAGLMTFDLHAREWAAAWCGRQGIRATSSAGPSRSVHDDPVNVGEASPREGAAAPGPPGVHLPCRRGSAGGLGYLCRAGRPGPRDRGRAAGPALTGDRALLLFPPGLEYVSGFLGCLY